jgi:hypothetical protein
MPGVAVTILVVGFSWLVFAGIANLFAMRFPNNPFSDALLDVYGSGSEA